MCHALVIEDDPLIAIMIEDVAREGGATSVDIAVSPDTALIAALATPPAVILSDVQIIGGTGPDAVVAIRAVLGPLPVIFITATPDACDPCDYAHAIITKPFRSQTVLQAFQAAAGIAAKSV